jgi:hypothetical protein
LRAMRAGSICAGANPGRELQAPSGSRPPLANPEQGRLIGLKL